MSVLIITFLIGNTVERVVQDEVLWFGKLSCFDAEMI